MKLSLAIIAKDQVEEVENLIKLYHQYFDEIVIVGDKEHFKFKLLTGVWKENDSECLVSYHEYKWINNFADKRNFLTSKINGDYYFRLDTDDTIENPEKIREVAEEAFNNNIDVVYCWYDYSKDEYGNTNAGHYRETIIKKTDKIYWNKPVHENLIPIENYTVSTRINKEIKIVHHIDSDHAYKSALRNIKILLAEYNRDKEKTDPRTLAYLGRMFFSCQDFDKAIFFLQKHIELSGWDEDRYLSWKDLGEIFLKKNNYDDAIACAFEAIQERPDYPQAYHLLHDIYFSKADFKKAVYWGEQSASRKMPDTFVVQDPSLEWRLALSLSYAYLNIGEIEKGYKTFKFAKEKAGNLPVIKENEELFEEEYYNKLYLERFIWMVRYLVETDKKALDKLIDSVPDKLKNHPIVTSSVINYKSPKKWDKKSVAIFCGNGPQDWADPSIHFGIGGSETAVILASREWVKLGYDVTVYCNCGKMQGEYFGVKYEHFGTFNPKDEFDILIGWRCDIFNLYEIKANKKIVWVHDNPKSIFNKPYETDFDYVTALSEYHKSMIPEWVPEEKIFITSNGIHPEFFEEFKDVKKQNKRIIYASSYDRGLETLLDLWPEVIEKHPEAELHIFYGWNTYDKMTEMGYNDGSFKKKMLPKLSQKNVFEHGRVGQDELIEEYAKSHILAYPCNFEGEINCIAYTQAVAAGCIPVTNDFAVLKERNKLAVKNSEFKEVLINTLESPVSEGLNEDYIKENSWETVAGEWVKMFN